MSACTCSRSPAPRTSPTAPSSAWDSPPASDLAPQLAAGEGRAVRQRFELCPHDGGMHPAVKRALGETAIGACHHILAPEQPGEAHDALGDQLGMLDDVGGVADHARHKHL